MKTKICRNTDCEIGVFKPKNPKQIFCSLSCKNKYAYKNNKLKYQYELILNAARRSNLKIIEQLLSAGHSLISVDILTKMSFNFSAGNIPKIEAKEFITYRFGNYHLKFLNAMECQITKV